MILKLTLFLIFKLWFVTIYIKEVNGFGNRNSHLPFHLTFNDKSRMEKFVILAATCLCQGGTIGGPLIDHLLTRVRFDVSCLAS